MGAIPIEKNKHSHLVSYPLPPSEWGGPLEGHGITLNKPEKSLLANAAVGDDGPALPASSQVLGSGLTGRKHREPE